MWYKNMLLLACLVQQLAAQNLTDEETIKRLMEIFPMTNQTITATTVDLSPGNRFENGTKTSECTTDDGQSGVCVLYYQCNANSRTVITDGETLIDVRQKNKCYHYLEVCCLTKEINMTKPEIPKMEDNGCGYSNAGASSFRIKDEGTAEYGEFPWMVALLRRTKDDAVWSPSDYIGGGSIIHPSVVLTAAHKVDDKKAEEIKCRAGEWDTQTPLEVYPYQERNVKKIIIHEQFNRQAIFNGGALLILETPYDLANAPHMGVACLSRQMPAPSTRCYSMGWGKEDFNNKDKYAVILKKLELPTYSRNQCQNSLRRTRLGSYFILHPSLTCAGGEGGRDTCTGDGGSPLVCPIEKSPDGARFSIYGLVAYGIGCGTPGIPGVYIDVPYLYDWIEEQMTAEGFGTSSYTY